MRNYPLTITPPTEDQLAHLAHWYSHNYPDHYHPNMSTARKPWDIVKETPGYEILAEAVIHQALRDLQTGTSLMRMNCARDIRDGGIDIWLELLNIWEDSLVWQSMHAMAEQKLRNGR